jgi:hypothetical protein
VVLKVSTGVRKMRHVAEPSDANAVMAATGIVGLKASSTASTPVLAAVSPKRERGFCTIANENPL